MNLTVSATFNDPFQQKKAALRTVVRTRRREVTESERRARDKQIQDHLITALEQHLSPGNTVSAFVSLPGEPGGKDLPQALVDAGYRVILPFSVPGTRTIKWRNFEGLAALTSNKMGLLQPTGKDLGSLENVADLAILPALSIGFDGTRLGQGGGYYDQQYNAVREAGEHARLQASWALIDDTEINEEVPAADHDLKVQAVVTPNGFHAMPLN